MKSLKFLIFSFLLVLTAAPPANAGETVLYKDGDTVLEGYWAPSTCEKAEPAPVVLVIHQWKGLGEYEKMRADMLAGRCYNAFAIDMYGQGIRPETNEEAGKMATLYKSDAPLARRRVQAALNHAKAAQSVDPNRVAAIGYCFGGTMALELARSGAPVNGVVSFHGGLGTPAPLDAPEVIKASIQVHHGADDPMVPPTEVAAFKTEMNTAKADWTLTEYAGAVHSFTHKDAGDDPSKGVAYDEKADKRSWAAALDFLREVFGEKE